MDPDLQRLMQLRDEEPPQEETVGERAARENRVICNKLTAEQREFYLQRAKEISAMETRTLKAGTVIKIEGIPLQLEQDVQASTAEGNWGLIEELKNSPQTGEGEEAK
jgi:hypothetical protein